MGAHNLYLPRVDHGEKTCQEQILSLDLFVIEFKNVVFVIGNSKDPSLQKNKPIFCKFKIFDIYQYNFQMVGNI
jgi:hypothetical protein